SRYGRCGGICGDVCTNGISRVYRRRGRNFGRVHRWRCCWIVRGYRDATPALAVEGMSMQLRDHIFLGMTQSLCPECLALVPAKIISRGGRVYFRKRCATHGVREDFVCSDVTQYDRMEFSLEGKVPAQFGTTPNRGCPYDCGLCTEHEQHTCV